MTLSKYSIIKIIQYYVFVGLGNCCQIDRLNLPCTLRITIFYEVCHLMIVLIDCNPRERYHDRISRIPFFPWVYFCILCTPLYIHSTFVRNNFPFSMGFFLYNFGVISKYKNSSIHVEDVEEVEEVEDVDISIQRTPCNDFSILSDRRFRRWAL